jgi:hypothetical protein
LIKLNHWPADFYAKALLHGVWRSIPFLDTKGYSEFIGIHKCPFIQDEITIAPPDTTPESLLEINWLFRNDSKQDELLIMETALTLFKPILWGLGLPPAKALGLTGDDIIEIFDLLGRAMKVQKERNSIH